MQTNPYLPSRTESEQTRQESKGSVVVKILAAGSVLICVLLALLMAWARLLWWKNAGVPAGGEQFSLPGICPADDAGGSGRMFRYLRHVVGVLERPSRQVTLGWKIERIPFRMCSPVKGVCASRLHAC
jgi:hypothetical protein